MELTQVKGNTWVIEASEQIPLYKLDDHRCILLDSGLVSEREELDALLQSHGLTPAGILCSHAHVDHCANNGYLQEKYHTQVAMTPPEIGMCSCLLNLKCYFLTLPPSIVERESSCMIHTPDVVIPLKDGPFDFCGATFQIIQTPGHSAGHICTITPDNVCYTADAMLSYEYMRSKLPYNLSQKIAEDSREKLRNLGCDFYIMAHNGLCAGAEFERLIDLNNDLVHRRTQEILDQIDHPMTASEVVAAACEMYQLFTKHPRRSLRFERNVRFFIEYLVDQGKLEMVCHRGSTLYRRVEAD